MDDIVGVAEIAQRLDVTSDAVHKWARRYDDFPRPIAELSAGLVWAWPDVAKWAEKTERLP